MNDLSCIADGAPGQQILAAVRDVLPSFNSRADRHLVSLTRRMLDWDDRIGAPRHGCACGDLDARSGLDIDVSWLSRCEPAATRQDSARRCGISRP